MKRILIFSLLLSISLTSYSQESGIVKIIDELTINWDESAPKMKTYFGMKDYCRNSKFRISMIKLLNDIHHYDSALYKLVTSKYDADKDEMAKKTLDDIILLESDYTTRSFLKFLHTDCSRVNDIERNYAKKGGSSYKSQQKSIEKELVKYVKAITHQIDIVDKHIHHLKGL